MRPAVLVALAACVPMALAARAQPARGGADLDARRHERMVDSLVGLMTLEEKLGQLTQYSGRWAETGPTVPQGGEYEVRAGRVGSFLNIHGAEPTCRIQRMAVEESRLGIPLLFGHDVIHGFRTIFPVPLAEASTFDADLAWLSARIAAREAAAAGLHWTFAPMVDIARDPRWGRVVEGSGEDPHLGSVLAVARVQGFQGDAPGVSNGAALADDSTLVATAKHFAAYGGAEGGRDYNTVDVSERTLREIYLPPFEAAVRAGAQTLMASFNEIAGVPATASRWLMSELLRDEWAFDGFVVSDYTGVWELMYHGVAADSTHAARLALAAGVDMEMVSGMYLDHLAQEVRAGRLAMSVVDEAVRRVLRVKARAGLFDDPYRYCDEPDRAAAVHLAPAHRRAAREIAARSIVLLQNRDGTLPFRRDLESLAVVGALAADSVAALGVWSAAGRAGDVVTILEGLHRALPGTRVTYSPGYAEVQGRFVEAIPRALSSDTSGFADAVATARAADAVVLVMGEHRELSGEAASRTDISLPGAQLALARRILATGRPVAVVLTNGRPLAIPELAAEAPAILEAWQLGTEMGSAVADVLLGDVNPSGRLPMSFPRSVGQVPVYYNHKRTGRPERPDGNPKFVSRYLDSPNEPLYPFGFGLSYTTFTYSSLRLDDSRIGLDDTVYVTVDVTNDGARAGDEIVQLYVRDEVRSLTPPVRELKGFARITLAPGETRSVTLRLPAADLRFWGPDDRWTVEPGWFTVYVGPSSAEGLEARFEVTG